VVGLDEQFRESRVLQSIEAEKTVLELGVINAVDIVLSITHSYEVLIG
jgi:hypothetical protein